MFKLKMFHIKLTPTSKWIIEIGYSLGHIMSEISHYDDKPYAYFTTEY
jgi:hypothetical protein